MNYKPVVYLCPSGISITEYLRRSNITEPDNKQTIKDFLVSSDEETFKKASAEINSLYKMGLGADEVVVFFTSDTEEGEMVATLLADFLRDKKGCKTEVKRIKGLQIYDRARFDKEGIPNLTEEVVNQIEKYQYTYSVVINTTAGFKATVPYLTFIGMVFQVPIKYLFEKSEEIIELPSIPLDFDLKRLESLAPVIDRIIDDFISLQDITGALNISEFELKNKFYDILLEEDGLVTLRPTGRILYKRYLQIKGYKKVLLSERVYKKLHSSGYNRDRFESLFRKMKDPVHLRSKLHNEVKRKGKIELDCYKPGATGERVFFYVKDNNVYICEVFMHDEYERAINEGELLEENFPPDRFRSLL